METPTPTTQPKKTTSVWPMVALALLMLLLFGLLVRSLVSPTHYNTREGVVKVDIGELSAALTAFKSQFGGYPPSRITLHKDSEGWNADRRSKTILRKFWPQFDFSSDGGLGLSESKTLNGSECLVFFLGGVRDESGTPIGFSKNPARPFSAKGTQRLGPFLEDIDDHRLVDTNNNGFSEYLDSFGNQPRPFVYFSSYGGRGYDPEDETFGLSFYRIDSDKPWKPDSYQIISPGRDGEYGIGGVYNPDVDGVGDLTGSRETERDNITNFSGGTLADE